MEAQFLYDNIAELTYELTILSGMCDPSAPYLIEGCNFLWGILYRLEQKLA